MEHKEYIEKINDINNKEIDRNKFIHQDFTLGKIDVNSYQFGLDQSRETARQELMELFNQKTFESKQLKMDFGNTSEYVARGQWESTYLRGKNPEDTEGDGS